MSDAAANSTSAQRARFLNDAVRLHGGTLLNRGVFVESCESTQDEARRLCDGTPGLVVLAGRQTNGRGRLGRTWHEGVGLGIAMSFVLDASLGVERLSLAGALGAYQACADCMLDTSVEIGLKWPNDVVERMHFGPGRKLAGVLVELDAARNLAILGVGVNVLQHAGHWPSELRGRATSLSDLGSSADQDRVVLALVRAVAAAASRDVAELSEGFTAVDTLTGTHQRFVHDGRHFAGLVRSIDPAASIRLVDAHGVEHALPALTTSLVKD